MVSLKAISLAISIFLAGNFAFSQTGKERVEKELRKHIDNCWKIGSIPKEAYGTSGPEIKITGGKNLEEDCILTEFLIEPAVFHTSWEKWKKEKIPYYGCFVFYQDGGKWKIDPALIRSVQAKNFANTVRMDVICTVLEDYKSMKGSYPKSIKEIGQDIDLFQSCAVWIRPFSDKGIKQLKKDKEMLVKIMQKYIPKNHLEQMVKYGTDSSTILMHLLGVGNAAKDPFSKPEYGIDEYHFFSNGKDYVLWSNGLDYDNDNARIYSEEKKDGDIVRYSSKEFYEKYLEKNK